MSYDECIRTVPAKKKKKWVTLFYVNPVWQFMKTVKKPNKAVLKVDK